MGAVAQECGRNSVAHDRRSQLNASYEHDQPNPDEENGVHDYGFPCIRVRALMQENLSEGRQTLSWGVS